jgi:hypothetical protein
VEQEELRTRAAAHDAHAARGQAVHVRERRTDRKVGVSVSIEIAHDGERVTELVAGECAGRGLERGLGLRGARAKKERCERDVMGLHGVDFLRLRWTSMDSHAATGKSAAPDWQSPGAAVSSPRHFFFPELIGRSVNPKFGVPAFGS